MDPYNLYPDWDGERPSLEEKEPQWKFRFTGLQAGLRTVSRSEVLSVVAMRGMRKLGTPGVQLWDPGRAIVRGSLSDSKTAECHHPTCLACSISLGRHCAQSIIAYRQHKKE